MNTKAKKSLEIICAHSFIFWKAGSDVEYFSTRRPRTISDKELLHNYICISTFLSCWPCTCPCRKLVKKIRIKWTVRKMRPTERQPALCTVARHSDNDSFQCRSQLLDFAGLSLPWLVFCSKAHHLIATDQKQKVSSFKQKMTNLTTIANCESSQCRLRRQEFSATP